MRREEVRRVGRDAREREVDDRPVPRLRALRDGEVRLALRRPARALAREHAAGRAPAAAVRFKSVGEQNGRAAVGRRRRGGEGRAGRGRGEHIQQAHPRRAATLHHRPRAHVEPPPRDDHRLQSDVAPARGARRGVLGMRGEVELRVVVELERDGVERRWHHVVGRLRREHALHDHVRREDAGGARARGRVQPTLHAQPAAQPQRGGGVEEDAPTARDDDGLVARQRQPRVGPGRARRGVELRITRERLEHAIRRHRRGRTPARGRRGRVRGGGLGGVGLGELKPESERQCDLHEHRAAVEERGAGRRGRTGRGRATGSLGRLVVVTFAQTRTANLRARPGPVLFVRRQQLRRRDFLSASVRLPWSAGRGKRHPYPSSDRGQPPPPFTHGGSAEQQKSCDSCDCERRNEAVSK